jgi:hypothetical protein
MAQKIDGTSVQLFVKRQYADKVSDGNGGMRDSAMAGKFYWICGSDEGRFTVEDGSAIHKAIESGDLWEIVLNKTDNGLEYITHTTHAQVVKRAKAKGQLKYYENFVVTGEVAPEDAIG